MKIFVCNRSIETKESNSVIHELLKFSENSIAILRETKHSENWKEKVEAKLKEVDFVIFLLGDKTFESDHIKWEFDKSKQLSKRILAIKLSNFNKNYVEHFQGNQIFNNAVQCLNYLDKVFKDDQELLLEQYKIMVSSTEKVTEQRLKVNNLFFTITSSILSISFAVGKAFNFSITGIIFMFLLALMALLVSFFWEKLINSYGKLNTGKFKVISEIEKRLHTNMFEHEWEILTKEIKYEPNTRTEAVVIQGFRILIYIIISLEIAKIILFGI
jgi:hypothetical protein